VEGDQALENGPQTRGLPLVVFTPCSPHLLAPAGVILANARLPEFLLFVWIWPPILRCPSTNEPVELTVYGICACYIH